MNLVTIWRGVRAQHQDAFPAVEEDRAGVVLPADPDIVDRCSQLAPPIHHSDLIAIPDDADMVAGNLQGSLIADFQVVAHDRIMALPPDLEWEGFEPEWMMRDRRDGFPGPRSAPMP